MPGNVFNGNTEQEWMSRGRAQPLIHPKMPVVDLNDMHKEQYRAIVDSLGRKLHTRQEFVRHVIQRTEIIDDR